MQLIGVPLQMLETQVSLVVQASRSLHESDSQQSSAISQNSPAYGPPMQVLVVGLQKPQPTEQVTTQASVGSSQLKVPHG